MKFYRVKYTIVDRNKKFHKITVYLFSPLESVDKISRFVFNLWGKNSNGFIIRDIAEISAETFAKENKENLQTMILSTIEED